MNIHIRRPVEYEKIIANQDPLNIELTRHRMMVQQLLDSKDNVETLQSRLKDYIRCFDDIVAKLDPTQKLQKQPNFRWVIDSKTIQSSCWKFEAILPRIVLSDILQKKARALIEKADFIPASKLFDDAIASHLQVVRLLNTWKWKLPTANHPILHKQWNVSMVHHLKSMKNLCMLCVGIEKEMNDTALYKVAQRATAAAAQSIAFWPNKPSTLKLCESMQHLFSSHILWNRSQYGASIERLQTWIGHDTIDTFGFATLQNELDKIPFLVQERIQVNNGAYFDPIQPALPLPTPHELIHMGPKDVPHPPSTRNTPMEHAPDEPHAPEQ